MTVAVIVGARPQFVKAAPLLAAFANAGTARVTLIHSGQHSDANMSRVFFEELGLPVPDHQIVTPPGPQGQMTGHMLAEIEACLERERVDRVVVVGDTNTTLAGALAAVKLGITCAHVEAGLRSGNRSMPEEINRILVDQCSAVLFCPTQQAVRNLAAEGLTQGVFLVGDVMFDAIRRFRPLADQRSGLLAGFGLQPRGYYVLTVHRAGNTEDAHALRRILDACRQLEAPVLFPVHPRTRHLLVDVSVPASVRVTEPLGYLDMMSAVSQARAVLTDSGGLQKEAYFLNVPCVTLREETEWGETLAAGANVLAGTATARIVSAVKRVAEMVLQPAELRGEFGDGHAADAICRIILGGR